MKTPKPVAMNAMRHHTGRTALMILILLAVLAQGLVPAGFMPGKKDGSTSIVICTSTGTTTIEVGAEHNPLAGEDLPQDKAAPACPFAPVLAQDVLITPPVTTAAFTHIQSIPPLRAAQALCSVTVHAYLSQGPPLLPA